jgi:hypothetical protein
MAEKAKKPAARAPRKAAAVGPVGIQQVRDAQSEARAKRDALKEEYKVVGRSYRGTAVGEKVRMAPAYGRILTKLGRLAPIVAEAPAPAPVVPPAPTTAPVVTTGPEVVTPTTAQEMKDADAKNRNMKAEATGTKSTTKEDGKYKRRDISAADKE